MALGVAFPGPRRRRRSAPCVKRRGIETGADRWGRAFAVRRFGKICYVDKPSTHTNHGRRIALQDFTMSKVD